MSRNKRTVLVIEDDDEEEDYQSQSQSQTGAQLSPEDKTKLAGIVCNFLLVAESKKIPVKRSDIVKAVLKEHGRQFTAVMAQATDILEKVFAYKVVELESKKNNYILINNIGTAHSDNENTCKGSDAAKIGLLTCILAGIFMTGELMPEGSMKEYLKKLDIDLDSKEVHPAFGNISKLINQDFVRQKYLEITQDTTADPPTREYRWGERAHHELSKKDVLELVCKVYGNNMRPQTWTTQWRVAQGQE
ncbi:non-structural maintenance of chromosomes element 3 homolog isoform X1 [Procambarus clarkii]|uniref:non-structural maintenance of chromosomes element 3 homolog isoform X1 n=1 Tax=Procambarus clarkii TaxID=6728 RepID=UPI0037445DA9